MSSSLRAPRLRLPARLTAALALSAMVVAMTATPGEAAVVRRTTTFTAPTSAVTAAAIVVSGKVTHSPKGTLVRIRRQSGRSWITVASVRTSNTAGAYRAKFAVPRTRGTYSFDAFAPATKKLGAATSVIRKVIVRTRLAATLNSAASSVTNGASVALSGKVTPWVAKTGVTLQQRLAPTGAWAKALTLSPNSSGNWSANRVPIASATTQYRVVVATNGYYLGVTTGTVSVVASTPPPPPPPSPMITSTYVPDGTVSTAYPTTTLQVSAAHPGTWAVTTGSLPVGLTLSSAGVLAGIPTVQGTSTFTVTFTDTTTSQTADEQFSISVDPVVSTSAIPVSLTTGAEDTCRIKAGGALSCWGSDQWGELGINGDPLNDPFENTPQHVVPAKSWLEVSAGLFNGGGEDVCGIQSDRSLWCWGGNSYLEDGQSTMAENNSPVQVAAGTHWSQVAEGAYFGCGIRTDGTLWCWGDIGAAAATSGLVQFGAQSDWSQITAGAGYACAIDNSKQLWCWGTNYQGWLGDGTTGDQALPEHIGSASWLNVDASQGNTCGVQDNHTLWCWGTDTDGQLGQGVSGVSVPALWSPTQVGSDTDWAQVSGGGTANDNHTCAVKTGGTLWCWGSNEDDQGVGGATPIVSVPTQLGSSTSWKSVSAGGDHTCGLDTSGNTYCWGDNHHGQTGNGSTVSPTTSPVPIS